jgi:hypothetical protein
MTANSIEENYLKFRFHFIYLISKFTINSRSLYFVYHSSMKSKLLIIGIQNNQLIAPSLLQTLVNQHVCLNFILY